MSINFSPEFAPVIASGVKRRVGMWQSVWGAGARTGTGVCDTQGHPTSSGKYGQILARWHRVAGWRPESASIFGKMAMDRIDVARYAVIFLLVALAGGATWGVWTALQIVMPVAVVVLAMQEWGRRLFARVE